MPKTAADPKMEIAPKIPVQEWLDIDFKTKDGWEKALKILIARIEGRFFSIIDKIQNQPFAGFSVLAVDCLLIDTLQQFRYGLEESNDYNSLRYNQVDKKTGKPVLSKKTGDPIPAKGSGYAFKDFLGHDTEFSKYFKDEPTNGWATLFYNDFRCGILHQAEIKGDGRVKRLDKYPLVKKEGNSLVINRKRFHELLVKVFQDYVEELRNPKKKHI